MELGPVDQKEMTFKDISYLELWQPLCSEDLSYLCNFGRMYHEEQFYDINLNLDQGFRRKCHLKVFLICISDSPFVQQSVTSCAISVEGIIRNNNVKLFEFGSVVQEEMLFKIFVNWSPGRPSVRLSVTIYAIITKGTMGNIHVKLYETWTSCSGYVV